MDVTEAVLRRRAIRAFKPDPVDSAMVREMIETAKRAPSGGNLQPWRVHVLGGPALAEFKAIIAAKMDDGQFREPPEYDFYPKNLWEPLRNRRRVAGEQRYAALGLTREENGQEKLTPMNFQFFGAPVGLFFCLDRRVGPPQWSDVGMFMQTLMLLAVERGLATCPQEVWANWPKTVASFLKLPDDHMLFAGMSLGYADETAPLNSFRTDREPFENFAEIRGF